MVFPHREDHFPRWIALFPWSGALAPARETSRPGSDIMRPKLQTAPTISGIVRPMCWDARFVIDTPFSE
jgi:hypothetical protein